MNFLRTRIINRKIVANTTMQLQFTSTNSLSEIKIPVRIERGPTDILRALDVTVSRDPTAPDYKFIDDPFLIPSSFIKKRSYALARESGKKAAMWILQEHADLLKSQLSEPLIEAFLPQDKYENNSQVSEEILIKLLKQCRVSDVYNVYKLLEGNISKDSKQAVLEMLCYNNSKTNETTEEFIEQRTFESQAEIQKNTWKDTSDIENIFKELVEDNSTVVGAYNALICGTAKYFKVDKAWQLYNECINKNIPLAVTAYNSMISVSSLLKDNDEDRKVIIQTFLKTMDAKEVIPNIQTLNAALKSTCFLQNQNLAKNFALNLISEFKSIGIKPCLASYYYLLKIFCQENKVISNILMDILDELEIIKEITIQDPMDVSFFSLAMDVATNHMHNLSAADRLHKLLLTKNNYNFIGRENQRSNYYRCYLQIILRSETIDQFMKVYDTLVPHVYVPEAVVMKEVIEMLKLNDSKKSIEFVPRILSQMIMFGMMDKQALMSLTFQLMAIHCTPPDKSSDLHQQYASMAWALWTHIQETKTKRMRSLLWSGKIFGHMSVLLLRGQEFEKMLTVIQFLLNSQDAVMGCMHVKDLQEIFGACIARGHTVGAMIAVEYAHDYGFQDVESMAKTVYDTMPLNSVQENKLYGLFGLEVLQSKKQSIEKMSSNNVNKI